MKTEVRKRNASPSSSGSENSNEAAAPLLPVTNKDTIEAEKHTSTKSRVRLLVILAVIVILVVNFISDDKNKFRIKQAINSVWDGAERFGLMKAAPAYELNYLDDYPAFKVLEDNYAVIREECEGLLKTQKDNIMDMHNLGSYTNSGIHAKAKWQTFFFKLGDFIEENSALAPKTAELLHKIPNLYTAFFSIMDPHQDITQHWGYYKGYLRYHLGVIIPNDNKDNKCYLRVNTEAEFNDENLALLNKGDTSMIDKGVKYYWKNGQGVMFDDTYLHDAHNESDEVRVVLFLDVARKLPWYLHLFNKICLFVAMHDASVQSMRDAAVIKM